jgi:hypothetical protein
MLLCQLHHAVETFREDPIVCLHHFAVLALRRDERESIVVVLQMRQKRLIVDKAEFIGVSIDVLLDDLFRAIRAAIVYENIFPVGVTLSEDTLDTLGKIFASVIEGCNDTYEWIRVHNWISVSGLKMIEG